MTHTTSTANPHRAGTRKADVWDDREDARETLRRVLHPGTTVKADIVYVSRSGMVRDVRLSVATTDHTGNPTIWDVTHLAARATGGSRSPRDGYSIRVGGCGMDMGFAVVYGLSSALYPAGHPCTGHARDGKRGAKRCPSNDHSNGLRTWTRGRMHSDGGYALNRGY